MPLTIFLHFGIFKYLYVFKDYVCLNIYIKKTAQFCKHECYFFLRDFV